MEKTLGSVSVLDQEIVAGPPDVRLLGTWKVMAETKGRKKRKILKARIMCEEGEYCIKNLAKCRQVEGEK